MKPKQKRKRIPVSIPGLKTKFVEHIRGGRVVAYGEVVDWGRARLKRVRKKARRKTK